MKYTYKRLPTVEEAKEIAKVKYPQESTSSDAFVNGVIWALTESNRQRLSGDVCGAMKLRMLDIGQSVSVPIHKWTSVRTAASKLKKLYGVNYTVNKIHYSHQDVIVVTRTA